MGCFEYKFMRIQSLITSEQEIYATKRMCRSANSGHIEDVPSLGTCLIELNSSLLCLERESHKERTEQLIGWC